MLGGIPARAPLLADGAIFLGSGLVVLQRVLDMFGVLRVRLMDLW